MIWVRLLGWFCLSLGMGALALGDRRGIEWIGLGSLLLLGGSLGVIFPQEGP